METEIAVNINEETRLICQICNSKFENQNAIGAHIGIKHKIKYADYLVKYYMNGDRPKCPICNEETRYVRGNQSFKKYCINHANNARSEWSKNNGYGVNGMESWKKGLTKETSESIKKQSETLKSKNSNKDIEYKFENYLTEEALGEFLKFIFGDIVKTQTNVSGKLTTDFSIEGPSGILHIEFDGPYHYTTPTASINDMRKKECVENIIRIPYFIQIDQYVWDNMFLPFLNKVGIYPEPVCIKTNWQHGFISDKIVYPASYCSLGIKRFYEDLNLFGEDIKNKILNSIKIAASKHKNPLLVEIAT